MNHIELILVVWSLLLSVSGFVIGYIASDAIPGVTLIPSAVVGVRR